jgi:hypothetical protein
MRMDFGGSGINSKKDLEGFELPPKGTYHLIVTNVDDSCDKVDGLKLTMQCLSGTNAEGFDKVFTDTLFFPKADAKDGGKFATKRLARLLLASGAITEAQLGSDLDVDWQWLAGRQFIAKVSNRTYQDKNGNDRTSAELDGMGIWHLEDPEVAAIPKNNAMAETFLKHGAAPATAGTPATSGAATGGDAYEGL